MNAASSFQKAAESFRKDPESHEDTARNFRVATEFYSDGGRMSSAAKCQRSLAELYESAQKIDECIEAYQKASDFFIAEDMSSQASQCMIKVAQYCALKGDYERAVQIFEESANSALDSGRNLLRFKTPEFFMHACICHMAFHDPERCRSALEGYAVRPFPFVVFIVFAFFILG